MKYGKCKQKVLLNVTSFPFDIYTSSLLLASPPTEFLQAAHTNYDLLFMIILPCWRFKNSSLFENLLKPIQQIHLM